MDEEKLSEVKALLRITPLQREMDGLPVTLDEISERYKVPVSVLMELGKRSLPVKVADKRDKDIRYNSKKYLANRMKEIDDALIKEALSGKMTAIVEYNKLLGRVVEKSEVKVGAITREEIIRRNLQAERDLKELGYRVKRADGQVLENESSESALLSDGVCSDTEQEHGAEG